MSANNNIVVRSCNNCSNRNRQARVPTMSIIEMRVTVENIDKYEYTTCCTKILMSNLFSLY